MASMPSVAPGRFRRLTQAALSADSALGKVDSLADDVVRLSGRIDMPLSDIERTLLHIDEEITVLGELRTDAAGVFQTAQRILDLVEWFLTPAFVAKAQTERAVAFARQLQAVLTERLTASQRPDAEVVDLAAVRRRIG